MANRCTQNVNLKWFQYKTIHGILTTNDCLCKLGYIESTLCSFCNQISKSVIHLLYDCIHSRKVWEELAKWLKKLAEGNIDFTSENIILGFKGMNNNPVNVICLIVKQNIYTMSRKGKKPNFECIQKEILKYYQACKLIAFTNNTQPKFFAFWSSLHTLFLDLMSRLRL